jgi:hypothetical protein
MASLREHLVLEQVIRDLSIQKEISRQNWQRLRDVFGNRFTNAWRLVTESRVKKYVFKPSGRTLWIAIVIEEDDEAYDQLTAIWKRYSIMD